MAIIFPTATTTVLNIKLDTATMTDIPVSKQVWTGWPEGANDELSLAQIGMQQEHHLTVARKPPEPPRSVSLRRMNAELTMEVALSLCTPSQMPVLDAGSREGSSQRHSRQNSQRYVCQALSST